ncbi:cell wall hydrolase [Romboutsia lituseburensis]|uniref:cell wall hydrolase n=1 Tax=Romboutsia lituseburensis TaxID=1537 RepID=UPI00215A24A8|nr:cell wall hydrolase [Romboutsia lituseburensis]MCR8745811.1 cell wall hydrolase [Romboutsia lituseburensis]
MERCYKFIVSLLVLTYLLVPINQVLAMDIQQNTDDQGVPAVQANSTKQQKREVISITSDELLLLSKLVAGEARGESYEGQVAVAAVVINRVKDSRFPDSIRDVIYQQNAFSVVNDGSINMQPTDSAYKAAQEALYGNDPTNNAIYFWNPDIATCQWIRTLNPYMRIGNHVFAK